MKTRMKWGIALRLGVLLASFSVFAAVLAGYYTFDSSRVRLQGRAEQSLLATTQVLARHMQASQADLMAVEAALVRYFDTNSPRITTAQATLARLRKDLIDSDLPRPEETLTALAAAAGGR